MTTSNFNPFRLVEKAIERDLDRLQLRLPFPDEKAIDMERCCAILHVSPWVIRRLAVTPLAPGDEAMCISMYNIKRSAPMRVDYDSLVRFLEMLRERHGIPDRRPPRVFGRYSDENLLPFPWSDTITVEHVAETLSIVPFAARNYIESGAFEAYQLVRNSHWRISRNSFERYLHKLPSVQRKERPYGG